VPSFRQQEPALEYDVAQEIYVPASRARHKDGTAGVTHLSAKPRVDLADAERRLRTFIEKFGPNDQRLIRAVRAAMRKRLPTANELVWDNYNFFVIGYSPTERPSDSILSIAARANGVGLCFIQGASLPDPKGLLLGEGRQTRFIRVDSASQLSHPDVERLIQAAIAHASQPFPSRGRGALVIRSISRKQRPRQR
jgi:hypothetical protein